MPASLLYCMDEPPVPPAPITTKERSEWEAQLLAAWCDCYDAVASIAALVRDKPAPRSACGGSGE